MSRQYLSWSIAQLEEEFERAQDCGDRAAIERVVGELRFRTTPKARSLRQAVERFLATAEQPGGEQRGAAKPPPTAKTGLAQKPPPAAKGKHSQTPTAELHPSLFRQRGMRFGLSAPARVGRRASKKPHWPIARP